MQWREEEGALIAKFGDGLDFMNSLDWLIEKANLSSACIVFAIGMLEDVTLGYYSCEQRRYIKRNFNEPMELIALHGTIAKEHVHIHCALARMDNAVVGGHLFSARVRNLCEVYLVRFDSVRLSRAMNKTTGVLELQIE